MLAKKKRQKQNKEQTKKVELQPLLVASNSGNENSLLETISPARTPFNSSRPILDGVCVPAEQDVPSITSQRTLEANVLFFIIPRLEDAATGDIVAQGLRDAPGVCDVQLNVREKLVRIEMYTVAEESDEIALADVVNSVSGGKLVAYPVWQHRDRIVKIRVDGMRCMTNCGAQVIAALEQIPGVLHIHVDSKSKTTEVALGTGCTATEVDLIKCIREANPRFNPSIDKDSPVVHPVITPTRKKRDSHPGAIIINLDGFDCDEMHARQIEANLNSVCGVIDSKVDLLSHRAMVFLEAECTLSEPELAKMIYSVVRLGQTIVLEVEGMSCAKNCARKIEEGLNKLEDVATATVDFPTKRATVQLKQGSKLSDVDLPRVIHNISTKFTATILPQSASNCVVLNISGMSCAKNCATKVEKALKATPSVVSARVDFPTKQATIELERSSKLTDTQLIQVVRDAGSGTKFDASVVTSVSKAENNGSCCTSTPPTNAKPMKPLLPPSIAKSTPAPLVKNETSISMPTKTQPDIGEVSLLVGGMTCSSCSNSVESALHMTPGVISGVVNLATETATIRFDRDVIGIRTLIETIEDIGYEASYLSQDEAQQALEDQRSKTIKHFQDDFYLSLLFTSPIMVLMIMLGNIEIVNNILMKMIIPGVSWMTLMVWILSTPVQFYCARRFHQDAWKGIKNRVLGMAVLVSMGSNASYFYGVFSMGRSIWLRDAKVSNPDMFMTASMLICFVILGKYLEAIAKGKTSEALGKLLDLQVKTAVVLVIDGSKVVEEKVVPIELVQRGDVLKVVRGNSIPADGVLVYGEARVDEAMLTGESKTIKKTVGDRVMGATVNVDGLFHMKVTGIGSDTALSQIIRLVEDAQTSKAPIQAYADYIASIFVPTVIVLSSITFLVWYFLCITQQIPLAWIPKTDGSFVFAFNFGIATLVVACPCALGLATPTAVMVGTGVGATHGVLIKGGEPLEVAHSVNTILFDKTGTLTVGEPVVTDMVVLSNTQPSKELILLAGSAELGSEHPLSKAILDYAKFISSSLEQPTNFRGVSGRGISCNVAGKTVVIGNLEWMKDNGLTRLDSIVATQATVTFQNAGKTSIYMGVNDELCAVFGVADAPRPEAIRTVRKLREMGLDVWMVTGDNQRTALTIAAQLGIDRHHVKAEVIPSEKASVVIELQSKGGNVAMVGDGINDSPALAQANLGIAIGAGTEIAVETAGMVLMKSNLWDVITALDLSRTIFNRIRLNYVWALGYNCSLVPLAAGVLYPWGISIPPMFAGAAMAISSVSVVTSSLMLRYYQPPVMPQVFAAKDNKSILFRKPAEATPLLASSSME